jgi:hypothetical protein
MADETKLKGRWPNFKISLLFLEKILDMARSKGNVAKKMVS